MRLGIDRQEEVLGEADGIDLYRVNGRPAYQKVHCEP